MINLRSFTFQLVGWYAVIIVLLGLLFGAGAYVLMRESLMASLLDRQVTRARLVCESIGRWTRESPTVDWQSKIDTAFSPRANNRLLEITRGDVVLYSFVPQFDSAEPSEPPPTLPIAGSVSLAGRRLVAAQQSVQVNGETYVVLTGCSTEAVESVLRHLVLFVGTSIPILVAVAAVGGFFLVKRALSPVVEIARKAERISVENLSERLPIAETGDELERLAHSLNHLLQRLDDSLQHSRRFVADASHELRTPLTILQGGMESLLHDKVPAGERERIIGELLAETERLGKIVEALFALSRLDAGEAQRECVPVDLAKLVESTTEQMALLAEDKKINARCVTQAGVIVMGDRSRLKQVVVNLLDNAIKYTPQRGSVVLCVAREGQHAVFEVKDTGIGIPPQALSQVFDRFFRVDKARSRDLGGAGLGLAIARCICAAHGGKIEVQSTPGKGTSFRVTLPLSAGNRATRNDPRYAGRPPLRTRLTTS